MVLYSELKDTFESKGCKIIINEEEFNKTSRLATNKYKYIASCGHENQIVYSSFKNLNLGLICRKCVIEKNKQIAKKNLKEEPLKYQLLEKENIEYFQTIIENFFTIKITREGCLAGICIKPHNICEDQWLMLRIKSTFKPDNNYTFKCSNKYINCLILCICQSDKKMWLLDGNKINVKKKIGIGISNSKYSEYEITNNELLIKQLNHYYETFPLFSFDSINTPVQKKQQLEYTYVKYREEKIKLDYNYSNNGCVYDFTINGLKIQEKVANKTKNKNTYKFSLHKSDSKDNNNRKKFTSYKKGDADFYWLNINNNIHFYIIPEDVLIAEGHINDHKRHINLNPLDNNENHWSKQYLFDYTNPDIIKIKKMFKIE